MVSLSVFALAASALLAASSRPPSAEAAESPASQPPGIPVVQPALDPDTPPYPSVTLLPAMDKEGVELGKKLQSLHGAEWERVYREHAGHIRRAQETARQRDLFGGVLAGARGR